MTRFDIIETNKNLPWLLFIHGFAGNAGTWKNQVFEFKNKFNICLVDLPGHGYAELTKEDKISKNIYLKIAKEIIERLQKHQAKKVNVISFSMGTVVNYFILQEAPSFLEKSIMVSPVCGGTKWANLKGDLMCHVQHFLSFDLIVERFADFILPKQEDKCFKKDVREACFDLGRANFLFWYKSLKKYYNIMRENSLSGFNNLFIAESDGDLNLKPGVDFVVQRDNIPFVLVENCSHLYPLQKVEDFNKYLHSLLD